MSVAGPSMRRLLWLGAVVFVGAGALFVFTGWHRDVAPAFLLVGILYAILLFKR